MHDISGSEEYDESLAEFPRSQLGTTEDQLEKAGYVNYGCGGNRIETL